MTLTADQIESINKGQPVRLPVPGVEEEVVVVRASLFEELRELLEDEREKQAWAKLGRKARDTWAKENPD